VFKTTYSSTKTHKTHTREGLGSSKNDCIWKHTQNCSPVWMHMWFRVRIDSLGKLGLCVVNCSERQKELDPHIWKVDGEPCAFPTVQSLAANNFPCCELGRLHEVLERKVWSGVSFVCTMSTYPLLMEETNSLFCQPSWLWTMVWETKLRGGGTSWVPDWWWSMC